jgi:Tol biopolymer transport system component
MGHIDFVQLGERGPVPVDSVSTAGPGTPSWYPDGQRVRFFRGDAAWAIDRDGTNLLKLPGTGTTETAWSPDGSTVAWISHAPWSDTAGTNLTLKIGPADTASAEVSIDIGTCYCLGWAPGLAWSPDGTMVTFSSLGGGTLSLADGLYVVHRDGTGLQRVGPSGWGAPAWRPIP